MREGKAGGSEAQERLACGWGVAQRLAIGGACTKALGSVPGKGKEEKGRGGKGKKEGRARRREGRKDWKGGKKN
jgi:hypothetical protein